MDRDLKWCRIMDMLNPPIVVSRAQLTQIRRLIGELDAELSSIGNTKTAPTQNPYAPQQQPLTPPSGSEAAGVKGSEIPYHEHPFPNFLAGEACPSCPQCFDVHSRGKL